jgi:hypothetical protein
MKMKGFNVAECGHVVNILPPIDVDTASGASCVPFSMENYSHVDIIIQTGVTNATAGTITIEECTDLAAGTATAIAFSYYAETTAAGDTLVARTTVAATGVALSANDNCIYVISIDASELTDGYPVIQVEWSNPGGSTLGSAVAILSGSRYASDQSATAIA